jgi:hypothetical protein
MTIVRQIGGEPPAMPSSRRIDMSTGQPVQTEQPSPAIDPTKRIALEDAVAASHAQTVRADAQPFESEAKQWLRPRSYANALVSIVARIIALETKLNGTD